MTRHRTRKKDGHRAQVHVGQQSSANLLALKLPPSIAQRTTQFRARVRSFFKAGTVPTEILIFHVGVMGGVIFSALYSKVGRIGWAFNLAFVGISLLLYWVIRKFLRFSGRLRGWWQDQVLTSEKSRFSAGVLIVLLNTLHVLIAFFAGFMVIANLIYKYEFGRGVKSWPESLFMSIASVGIRGFEQFKPQTHPGRFLCAINSLLGLVFAALWVAIFMKSFDAVFRLKE